MASRRVLLVVAAIVVAAVAFGIAGSRAAAKPATIRVGYIPITDCAQLFVAKDGGLFAKHGIEVELVPLAGGSAILQALSSGAVDVAFSNLTSVVFYSDNAGPLKSLAGGTIVDSVHSEAGLTVLERSRLQGAVDLRGKTIAVNTLRNIVDLAVLRWLRLEGMRASSVTLTELPFRDMETALRAGRIDAAALPEPFLSRALANGGVRVLGDHFARAFGRVVTTGYFTTPTAYERQPEVFQRFNRAMIEATTIANEYSDNALQAINRVTSVQMVDLRRAGHGLFIDSLPTNALSDMRAWMREEGFLAR